jgi:hypothetical protein
MRINWMPPHEPIVMSNQSKPILCICVRSLSEIPECALTRLSNKTKKDSNQTFAILASKS